jgi:hypothetical protein
MIKTIEKHWLIISIFLLLAIMASFFLWPSMVQTISWGIIGLGVFMLAIFTINRNYISHTQGRISRMIFLRNTILEVLGVVISIAASVWVAGQFIAKIIPAVYDSAETARPGSGPMAGMLAGLLVALCVGLAAGVAVRWIWRGLTRKLE